MRFDGGRMIPDDVILETFDGTARLFPLPNLVVYPHVVQGLHLFEPRYRQLAADSIAADGLFAMASYDLDAESKAEFPPPLRPWICLGHIDQHEKLPDGRYQMRLRGLARAKIVAELDSDRLYRIAKVELIPADRPDDLPALVRARRMLAEAVMNRIDPNSPTKAQLDNLFAGELPLGHVVDLLAYAFPLEFETKYRLLATPGVFDRVAMLRAELGDVRPAIRREFPPAFSVN
jgi:Lon protease-like protein